jgi:hypothetical protein
MAYATIVLMRLSGDPVERPMVSRIYVAGFLATFGLGFVLGLDETSARTVGSTGKTFATFSGLRMSAMRPIFHAFAPSTPQAFKGGEFGFRVLRRPAVGFGLPLSQFDFGFPVNQFYFDAGDSAPRGCSSFYCTHYDPSHSTYIEPHRWTPYADPAIVTGAMSGLLNPVIVDRRSCDSETVAVPFGDEERPIKIVRC